MSSTTNISLTDVTSKGGIWGQILSLMSSPKLSFYNNIFMQHHGMVPCSYEQHVQ